MKKRPVIERASQFHPGPKRLEDGGGRVKSGAGLVPTLQRGQDLAADALGQAFIRLRACRAGQRAGAVAAPQCSVKPPQPPEGFRCVSAAEQPGELIVAVRKQAIDLLKQLRGAMPVLLLDVKIGERVPAARARDRVSQAVCQDDRRASLVTGGFVIAEGGVQGTETAPDEHFDTAFPGLLRGCQR